MYILFEKRFCFTPKCKHFVYSFVTYAAFFLPSPWGSVCCCCCCCFFFSTRSTRTCRCHGKWSFYGSSVFFGSEESVWSEITNPFLYSPKKTPPRQISSKVRQLMRWVYKTSVSHFKVKNKPLKDTGGKERFKRMLNFLLMDKGRLFFRDRPSRNSKFTKFSSRPIGALGLFWNATKQRSFWRIFRYVLYSIVNKITFLNRNLCICKYLILRRFKHFEIGLRTLIWDLCSMIFATCSADFTCSLNGSTSQVSVTRIAFKD